MNVPITLANGNTVELNNITESGSGYIRFSDGTQICYAIYQHDNSLSCEVSFPRSYHSSVHVIATPLDYNNEAETIVNIKDISRYNFLSISTSEHAIVNYIAIGRWKQPLY